MEANAILVESLPNARYARDRIVKFNTVKLIRHEDMFGMVQKEKRRLVINELTEPFKPLADYVNRKLKQLAARERGVEQD